MSTTKGSSNETLERITAAIGLHRTRFYTITGILGVAYAIYAGRRYRALSGSQVISAAEGKRLIQTGQVKKVIDVRTEVEYNMGHYPSASSIPMSKFSEGRVRRIVPNKSMGVIIYCQTGNRARRAAEFLREWGYEKVYYIEGTYYTLN